MQPLPFFQPPLLNAAGFLGFSPDLHGALDLSQLGAFVSNPVSARVQKPAAERSAWQYPGGLLLHTGLPNPGLNKAIRAHAESWARAPLPVIVHLLAEDGASLAGMIERLEGLENVTAVEIGPPPDVNAAELAEFVEAGLGELPLIVQLPLEQAGGLALAAAEAGASAVSLGAPRGTRPIPDGSTISGRLYGPGIFPQALAVVEAIAALDIPVIGGGGVYSMADADAMLKAGAAAVQLDAVLWRGWEG